MSRRRMTGRVALGLTVSLLGGGLGAFSAFQYSIYRANAAVQGLPLPVSPLGQRGSRILVLAAHCDDETLGTGGTLSQAARNGARVRVVLMTNGDGFPLAATRQSLRLAPSPETYMELARLREAEARRALEILGLSRDAATFLGYPDGGLSRMWTRHWESDRPYRSPYTRRTRSPYSSSFRPGAPHSGESVLADLMRIMDQERPTHLILPDAGDDHPDHWATHCFGMAALEALRCRTGGARDWPNRTDVRTYLIHRGDWPVPQGLHQEARLVPPAALLGVGRRWAEVRLDPEAQRRKREAILSYRSQTAVMRRFLTSFIRQDELFGELEDERLHAPIARRLTAAGLPLDWNTSAARLVDASRDRLLTRVRPGADLVELDALCDDRNVYFRLAARGNLSNRLDYRLQLRPIGGQGPTAGPLVALSSQAPSGETGASVTTRKGREWRLAVPRARLGHPRCLLVAAETAFGGVVLDRMSWRVLVLPAGGSNASPLLEVALSPSR